MIRKLKSGEALYMRQPLMIIMTMAKALIQ